MRGLFSPRISVGIEADAVAELDFKFNYLILNSFQEAK